LVTATVLAVRCFTIISEPSRKTLAYPTIALPVLVTIVGAARDSQERNSTEHLWVRTVNILEDIALCNGKWSSLGARVLDPMVVSEVDLITASGP